MCQQVDEIWASKVSVSGELQFDKIWKKGFLLSGSRLHPESRVGKSEISKKIQNYLENLKISYNLTRFERKVFLSASPSASRK